MTTKTYYLIANEEGNIVPVRTAGYGIVGIDQLMENYPFDPIWFGTNPNKAAKAIKYYADVYSSAPYYNNLQVISMDIDLSVLSNQLKSAAQRNPK